jgi:hypothetical protein
LKQSFTTCKLLGFKNFESLVFGAFLSKTENFVVFLLALIIIAATCVSNISMLDDMSYIPGGIRASNILYLH